MWTPLSTQVWALAPLLFFYKDGVSIKQPTKVDMPLNKETKPDPIY